jgi:hypothetical protein
MKKLSILTFLFCFIMSMSVCFAEVADVNGTVDWDGGVVRATGTGFIPSNATNSSQGYVLARRAAMLDGYRNLLETVKGVQIDSDTTVANTTVNDVIHSHIMGIVKGARIITEHTNDDGTYFVEMEVKLYGNNSIASAVLPNISQPVQTMPVQPVKPQTQIPSQTPVQTPTQAPTQQTNQPANVEQVTGVVIDASGLGLQRCMSPRVYDTNGRLVYGDKFTSTDFVIKNGMASYVHADNADSIATGTTRVGAKPLTVKAVGLTNHNYDIIVSVEDGNRMTESNKYNNYMINASMIFIS